MLIAHDTAIDNTVNVNLNFHKLN